ncbi:unnamed protein product [Paramecium sonneborni]|uniref:Uncharacterized protein n=1 Tax=Paramecium sonneborni TaxID=65129 RepID=A0A8S1N6Z8_9CILI|nr:unnamed protein product [Paramecium sonneborni]
MFALTRAFKFQQPIFAFSKFQLLQDKYFLPIKPKKLRNIEQEVHDKALQEWIQTYQPPKRITPLSEKILYYQNKFPHLKAKWGDLFKAIKQLPAEEQAKDQEIINKNIQEKKQVYQQLLEEYENKFYVKKGAYTLQQMYFQSLKNVNLKQQWVLFHQLTEEEKQKYQALADQENKKLAEKKQKLAEMYGISLKQLKKELTQLKQQSRMEKEQKKTSFFYSSSSSSDDEKSKEKKQEEQN